MPDAAAPRSSVRIADFWALTKPGVTRMCMLTTLGSLSLAPEASALGAGGIGAAVLGSGLAVGAANAVNMWWERGTDHLMVRTRGRPTAAGRISPRAALTFAVVLLGLAMGCLLVGTNALTATLAGLAFAVYVLLYTPLKYKSPLALLVGAIPGAAPPLLGWTAATGTIDARGLSLFAILYVWQIPHFLAICVYRRAEYERAGIRVVSVVRGERVALLQAIAWSVLFVPVSLWPWFLGLGGTLYALVAAATSLAYLAASCLWLLPGVGPTSRYARRFFLASLVVLPLMTVALALDVLQMGAWP